MKTITISKLKDIAEEKADRLITIYCPTFIKGNKTQQNKIRFKNLLKETESRLKESGLSSSDINDYLKPAHSLLDNPLFWEHQQRGLAVFLSSKGMDYYELPFEVPEVSYVGKRFNIKYLLSMYQSNGRYLALTIGLKNPAIFECDKYNIRKLDIPDLPKSFDEILAQYDPEKSLQFRTEVRTEGDARAASFHGQGAKDKQKKYIGSYFRKLDDELSSSDINKDLPMVIVGLDHLSSIFKEVSSYPNIVDQFENVNPHELNETEIHSRTWNIIEPRFKKEIDGVRQEYARFSGSKLASDSIEDIVKASHFGKTKYLYIRTKGQKWGDFDPLNNVVRIDDKQTATSMELYNYSALHTILNSGKVYTLEGDEMPCDCDIAAIYRY